MQYGFFDDARREYVITTPATPLPWINYLGSEEFLGMISNTAGGYCFYRDAKLQRILRYRYNSVPGDNGGWAKLYDVDEIGAYTESYSGYWQYEDGLLYLSLVPTKGNGVFVDDSFPLLMLDGGLRIGRTANGTGLPHFYSDMLMDTLEQPKG